jgi:aspartyl-tRNA(Asn)/glutamyl-tRNA(Gln) amidotransferase subunit A
MATSSEICRMDTADLARRIAAKELSPVEVLDAVLDRLDRLDPALHMFTTVVPEQARQDAKRIEADIAAGRETGPLAGVPTGVKDLIYTKGIRTASGSNAYADFVPDEVGWPPAPGVLKVVDNGDCSGYRPGSFEGRRGWTPERSSTR